MIRTAWIRVVQVLGFLRKELMDVVRQPRLVVTLVFGPFLILLLFGLGYDNQPPALKTKFVGPAGSVYEGVVDDYAEELSDWIRPEGFTSDEAAAMNDLHAGRIDVVVVFPADPMASLLAGQQAPIRVVHDKLDPIQQTAIGFATRLAVNRVNSAILAQIVGAGQNAIEPLAPVRSAVLTAANEVGTAVQSTDPAVVAGAVDQLEARAGQADSVVTATASFLRQFAQSAPAGGLDRLDEVHRDLDELRAEARQIRDGTSPDPRAAAARIVESATTIDGLLGQLQTIDPNVLVQPFSGEAEVAVPEPVGITDFYAPAAIVLLVQHLGVTFGALSFVRDRALGLFEILRVGPVTTAQTLIGKYGAYGLVGAVVAAALTALVVVGLKVPMAGQLGWVAAILALVLVASLGLGFFVSLVARSDSQAVQFAMIVLLASLFFGGFFLSLEQLTFPVELISLVLPVRYGIAALQDVMLRGAAPATADLAGLAILAVAGYASSWYLLRRQLRVV